MGVDEIPDKTTPRPDLAERRHGEVVRWMKITAAIAVASIVVGTAVALSAQTSETGSAARTSMGGGSASTSSSSSTSSVSSTSTSTPEIPCCPETAFVTTLARFDYGTFAATGVRGSGASPSEELPADHFERDGDPIACGAHAADNGAGTAIAGSIHYASEGTPRYYFGQMVRVFTTSSAAENSLDFLTATTCGASVSQGAVVRYQLNLQSVGDVAVRAAVRGRTMLIEAGFAPDSTDGAEMRTALDVVFAKKVATLAACVEPECLAT